MRAVVRVGEDRVYLLEGMEYQTWQLDKPRRGGSDGRSDALFERNACIGLSCRECSNRRFAAGPPRTQSFDA